MPAVHVDLHQLLLLTQAETQSPEYATGRSRLGTDNVSAILLPPLGHFVPRQSLRGYNIQYSEACD